MRRKYEYLGQLPNYSKLIFLRLLQQKILRFPYKHRGTAGLATAILYQNRNKLISLYTYFLS